MKFVCLLLFGAGVFSLSFIGYRKYQNTTLYALAIGGVVNANYFHAVDYPIDCFGLPFGIDSLIYTLFAFCVMVMLLKEDRRAAYLLAVSSVTAIVFSALMELIAALFVSGSSAEVWTTFASFMVSAFASAAAVPAAVEAIVRLKPKRSPYLCMALGIGIIALIHSGIYYPLSAVIYASDIPWVYVGTTFAGEAVAVVYSLTALRVLHWLKNKT